MSTTIRSFGAAAALAVLLGAPHASAQPGAAAPATDPWAAWRFLFGAWVAEPGPGAGSGAFDFTPELDGRVLVRRNHAEYPASGDRPAAIHDDLLVVWPDAGGARASYWDNEGHVIAYQAVATAGADSLVLTSAASAGESRFQLTYVGLPGGRVKVDFAIAPPGRPDAFATYLQGTARRR